MMTVADTIGQFFTYNLFHGHFTRRAGCLTSRQQETKTKCVYGMFLFCFFTFTLYTMRSCSPSLRVVPSYLISFTKDKANIFSDLSLAVEEKRNTQAIKITWLLVFTFETKTAFIYTVRFFVPFAFCLILQNKTHRIFRTCAICLCEQCSSSGTKKRSYCSKPCSTADVTTSH